MYLWINHTLDFWIEFCEKKVQLIHGRYVNYYTFEVEERIFCNLLLKWLIHSVLVFCIVMNAFRCSTIKC